MNYIFYILTISFLPFFMYSQEGSIMGKVTDAEGPVAFASVVLSEKNTGTLTDKNGDFKITGIAKGDYILEVSYMGYKTYKKKITITENRDVRLNIILETGDQQLDEIVITGLASKTSIRENPVAVGVVSQKEIRLAAEDNIIDVLVKNTPGLNVVKTGPNISKPFIRGLGYNRVLTLYNGVRQEGQQWGDEHGLEVDNYHIERAEIIKGPASLMYGSDALAGVVSLFSYIPQYYDGKIHGNLISEYQTNNGLIGNGLRLGYDNEHFVFALSGSYRVAKNYKNPKDGRVYLTNFKETNFSALAGHRSENGYTHLHFTFYDNKQGIPDGSRDSITRKFTRQIYEEDLDTPESRPVISDRELNTYKIPDLSQHIRHYRLFLHSSYSLGQGEADILLAGQQNTRREYNHPTQPKQPGMYVRLNTLNYSLRYRTSLFSDFEFSAGTNGMAQRNKNLNATDFPIPDYDLFDFGAFLYAKWKKKRWAVSGGIRHDIRHEKWDDFYVGSDPQTGFDHRSDARDPDAELPFPAFSKTFQDMSASLGATYKISDKISLKANIGRAFRAPNISELASNGLDPGAHIIYLGDRTFNPEVSLQEDIGASAVFQDWSAELNVFNNHIENYIFLNTVPDTNGNPQVDRQGNMVYQYQQTKAQLYGGEFRLSVYPRQMRGLKFDHSLSLVYGYNRAKEFKGQKTEGEYLPLMPPLNWKSNLSYEFKPRSSWLKTLTSKFGWEYAAAQDYYFGLNNTETRTPAYTLFNLGFSADIAYSETHRLQLLVQANNLFDKAYQSHLNRLKYFEDYENGNGIYDMGRNLSFKLIFPF